MQFNRDAERFLAPDAERLVALASLLAARHLSYSVIRTGGARHLMVRLGNGPPRLALAAHYDRYPGSPGVLDNSCACLQLVEFAARRAARSDGAPPESAPPLLLLFTDGEEKPSSEGATGQGAYALARALGASGALAPPGRMPPVLVLDVTGRGDRLVLSSAPARLLERNGLSETPLAAGHRGLVELAVAAAAGAGLAAPYSLELPWSDDLGLVLGGIPALTLSLLPYEEARAYPAVRPKTWECLHGPDDSEDLVEERSFGIVAAFLGALERRIASGRRLDG